MMMEDLGETIKQRFYPCLSLWGGVTMSLCIYSFVESVPLIDAAEQQWESSVWECKVNGSS